jgi:flagellar basal body-associated protein FliL
MKKNRKKIVTWILLSVLVTLGTGGLVGYKMYTKPHRNVSNAKSIQLNAEALAATYESNEVNANTAYLDKVLEVKGEINEVSKNQNGETVITLKGTDMSAVICTLEGISTPDIKPGSTKVLKGICTGFLTDVVMVRCVLQNN